MNLKNELKFIPILETNKKIQDRVREIRNMTNVRQHMFTDHIISKEEHQKWLETLKNNEKDLVMVVMLKDEPIGVTSLSNINKIHLTADWGTFYIKEDMQYKGIGPIIEYKLIEMAFNEVGLEKLNCEVLEANIAVIRLHKRFGFVEEGIRRKNIIKNGCRINVHLLGLLKDEWLKIRPEIQRLIDRISIF